MRYILLLVTLTMVGCSTFKKDTTHKQETRQQRHIQADVNVAFDPVSVPGIPNRPPLKMTIFDEEMTFPPNSRVKVNITSDRRRTEYDWLHEISTLTQSRKTISLVFIGAFCVAGAVVLFIFGMPKLAVAAGGFGMTLIGCGVLINDYPWVFLILIGIVVIGIAYVIYELVTSKNRSLTLEAVCDAIDDLKLAEPELTKKYITD